MQKGQPFGFVVRTRPIPPLFLWKKKC